MLKHAFRLSVIALGTLAFAASAHAAYLSVGTTNTYSASTTLTGSIAAPALTVKNGYGTSASAYGLYGLLTNTAPSANAAAVRGLKAPRTAGASACGDSKTARARACTALLRAGLACTDAT